MTRDDQSGNDKDEGADQQSGKVKWEDWGKDVHVKGGVRDDDQDRRKRR